MAIRGHWKALQLAGNHWNPPKAIGSLWKLREGSGSVWVYLERSFEHWIWSLSGNLMARHSRTQMMVACFGRPRKFLHQFQVNLGGSLRESPFPHPAGQLRDEEYSFSSVSHQIEITQRRHLEFFFVFYYWYSARDIQRHWLNDFFSHITNSFIPSRRPNAPVFAHVMGFVSACLESQRSEREERREEMRERERDTVTQWGSFLLAPDIHLDRLTRLLYSRHFQDCQSWERTDKQASGSLSKSLEKSASQIVCLSSERAKVKRQTDGRMEKLYKQVSRWSSDLINNSKRLRVFFSPLLLALSLLLELWCQISPLSFDFYGSSLLSLTDLSSFSSFLHHPYATQLSSAQLNSVRLSLTLTSASSRYAQMRDAREDEDQLWCDARRHRSQREMDPNTSFDLSPAS